MEHLGTITSPTASLILVLIDAAAAPSWVPTKPAANKAQFTGHPAEVMRGLATGDDVTPIDVGPNGGFAFELEGKSGRIDVVRTPAAPLVLVAPPRAWWAEHHGEHDLDALFTTALAAHDEATEVGELELTSGQLLAAYLWLEAIGSPGERGLIVELGAGRYRLARHETPAPWDDEQVLVTMFLLPA